MTTFACPLRRACLRDCASAFSSYAECNAAVLRLRDLPEAGDRAEAVSDLFRRLLPLVRKTLRRFCPPVYHGSRCDAGACYPEELVGESYLALSEATLAWDTSRQVDFLGFFGQFLYWRLEHRARDLRRAGRELAGQPGGDECLEALPGSAPDEDELLTRAAAATLLERLDPDDADLVTRAAEGYASHELAEFARSSPAGVRKRLERIRRRLREPAS